MACCGQGRIKGRGVRSNGKTCPRCGWIMHRVHKYNTKKKEVDRFYLCTNKVFNRGKPCGYRENLK